MRPDKYFTTTYLIRLVILTLVCFCTTALGTTVKQEPWQFRVYTSANGLTQNTVNAITQDQQGFIWVGTQFGVNRFDGYEFDTFTYNRGGDSYGLKNNFINRLLVDRSGIVWAGTAQGVQFFNPLAGDFDVIPDKNKLTDSTLTESMAAGMNNDIWVGNQNGLLQIDSTSKVITKHLFPDSLVSQILVLDDKLLVSINRELLVEYTSFYGTTASRFLQQRELKSLMTSVRPLMEMYMLVLPEDCIYLKILKVKNYSTNK